MSSRHPLLLALLLLLLSLLSPGGNSTDPSQCASLLDLKHSLNSTTRLATWRPGTDCCTWDGVTCDSLSGLITALDLSSRSLRGKLSASLFNLTSLRKLNLAYNLFDQIPIPNEFALLANLTHLNLSNAGFIGQIPIGISKLTNLVSLDLSVFAPNELPQSSLRLMNPDFGSLIRNLSNLKELRMDGTVIGADGYQWSSALAKSTPKLEVLSLSACSITRPIGSLLANLRNLSVIQLDQNELNCSVPDFFGNFSSLRVVNLNSCGLRGAFPTSIFLLKQLSVVDLRSNPMLGGSLPGFIDGSGSQLKSLLLSATKFSGQLSDSIGKLKSLIAMDLSNCQFSGAIPASIGNLTQLVYLELSSNNFSGQIPSSVRSLRQLAKLDLSNNSLSGQIPPALFSLPSLGELRLNLNHLSGQLQEFSNGSSRLVSVDLSDNSLQGEIPRSVFKLSGLEVFSVASNNFSGTLEFDLFIKLKNLTSLQLSYNKISVLDASANGSLPYPKFSTLMLASCNLTRVPGFLRNQDKISYLDLSDNGIHGEIPKWLWSVGNGTLNYLNLSCNSFTSLQSQFTNVNGNSLSIIDLHSNLLEGPIQLPRSPVVLDYSNNRFSSSIPSNISAHLNYTIFFSLARNSLIGEIPASVCNATYLQVLDFSGNMLNGQIPPCLFEGGNSLAILNLRGNKLNGTIAGNISKECGLITVDLSGNLLEGQIPRSLANCNKLEVLDLGNNRINGSFPFWLADMYSPLRVLILGSNALYGPLDPSRGTDAIIKAFPRLQIFDISSNYFSGPLPLDCFKNLKAMRFSTLNISGMQFEYLKLDPSYYQNTVTVTSKGMVMTLVRTLPLLTSLDFSSNRFEGSIPDVIGELQALNVLNFSRNSLTGSIPQSIGKLVQLESLDLSGNLLSGDIPETLSNLTFLSFLNLSNNNLVGAIPQSNQLSTFSNSSFQGNKGLCGVPLTKQCKNSSTQPRFLPFKPATEVDWQFVFIGVGFGGGLALVVGTLMSWETGRNWYLKKVDRMLQAIIPPAFWRLCEYFGDGRIRDVEETDSDSKELGSLHGQKFCVFCTKLEFCQEKVRIHHTECNCPLEDKY